MKYLVVLFVVLFATVITSLALSQSSTYTLTPVADAAQAVECGKDKGLGAIVFQLDVDGQPVGESRTACLRRVR